MNTSPEVTRARLGLVWIAGLVVAIGAGVATAHGLYEVALAARVPRMLAWLYPLITDGLALVAYATTTRLADHGRRYAWTVVVVAAALSGLTQAGYLAGSVASAPPVLRFAIGAWPAVAAAIVAHLLYLLSTERGPVTPPQVVPAATTTPSAAPGHPAPQTAPLPTTASIRSLSPTTSNGLSRLPDTPFNGDGTRSHAAAIPTPPTTPVVRRLNTGLDAAPASEQRIEPTARPAQIAPARASATPAVDRALTLAREHAARHGQLPTVTELVTLARVARGTAATALKTLRQQLAPHPTGKAASDARRQQ
jgi:hypothetical protein